MYLVTIHKILSLINAIIFIRSPIQEAHQYQISLAFLHFAQNYPSSVSTTLQSRCRALKVFYQRSLLPLCNVFCHVYESSLKLLEIDNISSVSKVSQNQATNSSVSIFKLVYNDNIFQQICGGHNWIIRFSCMKNKMFAFHISFNKAC